MTNCSAVSRRGNSTFAAISQDGIGALDLDNGSTYRGQTLSLACARMGTALIHAKPYDAPARGKTERFWRTLREGCLDFVGSLTSLHDLNVRLWAWLDEHYHRAPHAGLVGATLAASTRIRHGLSMLSTKPCSGRPSPCMHGVVVDATAHCVSVRATAS